MANKRIVIEPTEGLCNRLRVLFSYYEYAKKVNAKLVVIWKQDSQCNGYFLNIFKPLPNVSFRKNNGGLKVNYKGFKPRGGWRRKGWYSDLRLKQGIKKIISNKIDKLNNDYVACHIRRTDLKSSTTDKEFFTFLNNHPKRYVYIATDNRETFKKFKKRYKNRLLIKNYHRTNPSTLRRTTLRSAVIDLFMCIYATKFKGTRLSSFTDTIHQIRCDDKFPKVLSDMD